MAMQMEVNGQIIRIGARLPPPKVTNVELRMSQDQAQRYFKVHMAVLGDLGAGFDEESKSK